MTGRTGAGAVPRIGMGRAASALLLALSAVLLVAQSACSDAVRACHVGSDCASGACDVQGMCVPLADAGHGADAKGDTGTPPGDSGNEEEAGSMDGGCSANDSGTILRNQIVFQAGLHATYRIAENATVSTAGLTQSDGSRSWDLSGSLPGDQDVLVETLTTSGTWYASKFPQATYASQLENSSPLQGVFQATESDLLLQGVVSPDSGLQATELTYMPAVVTLQFPLMQGSTWSTHASVTGKADGIYGVYTEDYKSSADAHGKLKTPLATFDVLRVGTVLTRTAGVTVTTIRSYVFVTDCYGAVATIASKDDEPSAEFTTAAEVRRIAP